MNFSIIVATDKNGGIGKSETGKYSIPWKNEIDMKFFKDTTKITINSSKKNVVIMGKNTFFSLPQKNNGSRQLSNRINIVITSNSESLNENILTFKSLDLALNYCSKQENIENIFVIGGAKLFAEAIYNQNLESIYLNKILDTKEDCNIYFPVNINLLSNITLDRNYEMTKFNSKQINFLKYIVNSKNIDEQNYINTLKNIMQFGDERQTRNSVTKSIFGERLVFDLKNKFPLLTTKKMFLRAIFEELKWFLGGETDSKLLEEKNVNIWKGNSSKEFINSLDLKYREGDIGPMYGFQWRYYGADYLGCDHDYSGKGFDQIEYCLNLLKKDKYSRRILMTSYSPNEASKGVLYPCHGLTIQWFVRESDGINYLSCHMYQRSADMFLGVPFNISSYAMLCYMFCEVLNNDTKIENLPFRPDRLVISFGDLHIYECHYEQVKEQITRQPYIFPQLNFKRKISKLEDFIMDDIIITNYNHHAGIKGYMVA